MYDALESRPGGIGGEVNTHLACRVLHIPEPGRSTTEQKGVHRYGFWRSTRCGELRRAVWDERTIMETLILAKKAYRARAMMLHPDHGGMPADMVELTLAWRWLARHLIRKAARLRAKEDTTC